LDGGIGYARRLNQDGTLDSICERCGLTTGRAFYPGALEKLEARHVCQPVERRGSLHIAYRTYDPSIERRVRLCRDAAEQSFSESPGTKETLIKLFFSTPNAATVSADEAEDTTGDAERL
jgi:hypothetical protein